MCSQNKETFIKLKYRGTVYRAWRVEKAGWSTGGDAGFLEWVTDARIYLSHFACEDEHLTIALFF